MSLSSSDVLEYVRTHPGCTSRDIAEHYGTTVASVSTKATRLFDQGCITREPEDIRQAPRGMCYRLWVIA